MPLIKRYPNRKLYDTAARQYISLDGIAEQIRAGAEIEVADHATGEDVTALILMQIVVEQERRQSGFVPRSALAGLVQAGGDRLSALRRGLAAPLDLMRHVDEEIERRIQRLILAGELAEGEGLRLVDQLLSAGRLEEATVARVLGQLGLPTRSALQALTAQLDALETELDALGK